MQLSVLLPSLRPEQLAECLPAIHKAAEGLDYEIIVVCDTATAEQANTTDRPDLAERLAYYIEAERRGPIAAILDAAAQATGDYFFVLSDEDRLHPLALTKLHLRAELARSLDKHVIHCPWFGQLPGWRYYNRVFPPFPFIHRDLAKELGGLFDPAYSAHFADPDLGMRAAESGVEVRLHGDLGLTHKNPQNALHTYNREQYYDRDEATFRAKWAHLETPECRPEFTFA